MLGVPEGLALVGTDVHDDRTNSTAVAATGTHLARATAVLRGGGCPFDPDTTWHAANRSEIEMLVLQQARLRQAYLQRAAVKRDFVADQRFRVAVNI